MLSAPQVAERRRDNIALAYDPVLIGWVDADVADDLAHSATSGLRAVNTDALGLRAWTQADAADYAAMLGDRELWRYMPEPYPGQITEATARELIALTQDSPHHHVLAVLQDDVPVGQVRAEFGASGDAVEISYWIGRAWWGRGLASQAVAAFCKSLATSHPSVKQLTARVHQANTASQRVVTKLGFADTGPCPHVRGWRTYARAI